MHFEKGIWSAALDICKRNSGAVAAYVGLMMVIGLAQDFISSSGGLAVAQAFAAALLAIPAHLSVLKNIDSGTGMKMVGDNKVFGQFVWRGFGLGFLALIVPFVVLFGLLIADSQNVVLAFGAFGLLAALLAAAIFAKWGTMLPAIVVGNDKRFATAGQRGSHSFGYAFPRLLLSFGGVSLLMILLAVLVGQMSNGDGRFFPDGGVDAGAILSALAGNVVGAYQVALTAVILSRAYLMAEAKTAA